jgi:hypothetical protein
MEAYRIDRFGSVGGIVLRSSEDPRPGLKEILMRVRASSLNYRDLMVLKGGGRGPTKIGVVPLSDGAGARSQRATPLPCTPYRCPGSLPTRRWREMDGFEPSVPRAMDGILSSLAMRVLQAGR